MSHTYKPLYISIHAISIYVHIHKKKKLFANRRKFLDLYMIKKIYISVSFNNNVCNYIFTFLIKLFV